MVSDPLFKRQVTLISEDTNVQRLSEVILEGANTPQSKAAYRKIIIKPRQ